MHKIVVIGGGGYIAFNLIKKLTKKYHIITCIRNSHKHREKMEFFLRKNIECFENIDNLTKLQIDRNTTIVYLAGYSVSDHSYNDIEPIINTYVTELTKTLEICRKNNCDLIIAGSYWELVEVPNLTSINLYAAILKSQNLIVKYFAETFGLSITKIYLSDVYGPEDFRPKILPTLLKSLKNNSEIKLGSPDQIIAPIYIDDVTEIIIRIIGRNRQESYIKKFSEIQIEPVKVYSLAEYVEEIEKFFLKSLSISWDSIEKTRSDILKYPRKRSLCGPKAFIDLHTGLKYINTDLTKIDSK